MVRSIDFAVRTVIGDKLEVFPVRAVIGDELDVKNPHLRALLRGIPRIVDDTYHDPELRSLIEKTVKRARAGPLPKPRRSSPGRPRKCQPLAQAWLSEIAARRTTLAALKAERVADQAKRYGVSKRTVSRARSKVTTSKK